MDIDGVYLDLLDRVHGHTTDVLDGAQAELLAYRPDPDANSLAWLVWHACRVLDTHVAELIDDDEVWIAHGWVDRFALPYEPRDHGFRHTSEQVGAIRPDGPEDLRGYHLAVDARVRNHVAGLHAGDLDEVVDRSYDPPVTLGARLVSIFDDAIQHLGQARYVRGMYERTGGA